MHNFKKLQIWQESVDFTGDIYRLSSKFPDSERYGLTSQIRKCAVSVPSNIAERSGRGTSKDFENFLNISTGSSFELETQLIIANKLNFIYEEEFQTTSIRLQSIQRKIFSFKEAISRESIKSGLKKLTSWFLILGSWFI